MPPTNQKMEPTIIKTRREQRGRRCVLQGLQLAPWIVLVGLYVYSCIDVDWIQAKKDNDLMVPLLFVLSLPVIWLWHKTIEDEF